MAADGLIRHERPVTFWSSPAKPLLCVKGTARTPASGVAVAGVTEHGCTAPGLASMFRQA